MIEIGFGCVDFFQQQLKAPKQQVALTFRAQFEQHASTVVALGKDDQSTTVAQFVGELGLVCVVFGQDRHNLLHVIYITQRHRSIGTWNVHRKLQEETYGDECVGGASATVST